ncbi:MAG: SufD family Fe-S cluster assembly protein [Oscillospiraceae bacterium]|jgi:Fe-S cluster assembly scaffold protein SufB|nr:SufD family Fe-S cluster assembly protein [Oscillospiraceae bacterium]
MPTALKNVNALPVPTWRRLGVNGAELIVELPEPGPRPRSNPSLPAGTLRAHESVLRCAEFRSALSPELAAYIRVHANCGARFRVKRGESVAEPVTARHTLTADAPAVVDNNVVYAEAHSRATLVLVYDSADDTACFHAGLTRVIAENCAEISVVEVQTLNAATPHFTDFSAVVANGAKVSLTRVLLGGADVYAGTHFKLEGGKSESNAEVFYLGDGERKLDFSYIAKHLGQHTSSALNSAGALFGSADKIMRGTIDFARGSSGSVGGECENTLILSDGARNRSAPLILCGEESVEGTHAASCGSPDAAKLYYLMSRGLSEREAKTLLVAGLLEPSLKNVPDEKTRAFLREYLTARIK